VQSLSSLQAQVEGGWQARLTHTAPVGAQMLQFRLQQYWPALHNVFPQGIVELRLSVLSVPASGQIALFVLQSAVHAHTPLLQAHVDGMQSLADWRH
jgi:hypothetical protein